VETEFKNEVRPGHKEKKGGGRSQKSTDTKMDQTTPGGSGGSAEPLIKRKIRGCGKTVGARSVEEISKGAASQREYLEVPSGITHKERRGEGEPGEGGYAIERYQRLRANLEKIRPQG